MAVRVRAALSVSALLLALSGCGGGDAGAPKAAVTGPAGCRVATSASPAPTYASEPPLTVARTTYRATVATTCGTITVALDAAKAPHTVNSFVFLADKGYFDKTPCHRLTTSGIFVLQCGDPTGTGSGGPGYALPDENLAGATYPAGTVAMANAGPDTGGSQFFFVYGDTSLPPSYTPFGRVTTGLDVLRRIAKVGSDEANGPGDGSPNAPVSIESVTVAKP